MRCLLFSLLLIALAVTTGCGAAESNNRSPIASESDSTEAIEAAAKREASDRAAEEAFFRKKATQPK